MDRTALKYWFISLVLAPALALHAHAQSLAARIDPLLAIDQLRNALVGIQIDEIKPSGPLTLYTHRANLPLIPASNAKILTTAAAFETYGPKATLATELYWTGTDLVIKGSGDPGFGDPKLALDAGWTLTTVFDRWAEHLKKSGITSIRNIIVDDSVFDAIFLHPNWPAKDRSEAFQAPVGALNFNDNCRIHAAGHKTTEGQGAPVADPGLWTAAVLRDRLLAAGIKCGGVLQRGGVTPGARLVARHETPLSLILKRANKNSINLMAECLCKKLGHDATGQPGTWDNGPAAVKDFLKRIGISQSVTLEDGSGLSPNDRVPAAAFVAVLDHIANLPNADAFVNTLAMPGQDGTLRSRFAHSTIAADVHAKTGHIKGASTLSGYLDVNGRRFAFSILCNKYQGNVNSWQDKLVETVAKWGQSSQEK